MSWLLVIAIIELLIILLLLLMVELECTRAVRAEEALEHARKSLREAYQELYGDRRGPKHE
jgi:hypothetical protein